MFISTFSELSVRGENRRRGGRIVKRKAAASAAASVWSGGRGAEPSLCHLLIERQTGQPAPLQRWPAWCSGSAASRNDIVRKSASAVRRAARFDMRPAVICLPGSRRRSRNGRRSPSLRGRAERSGFPADAVKSSPPRHSPNGSGRRSRDTSGADAGGSFRRIGDLEHLPVKHIFRLDEIFCPVEEALAGVGEAQGI